MEKIKNLYEKIIYAKFSVDSEYVFIIFIVQLLKKLCPKNWESKKMYEKINYSIN